VRARHLLSIAELGTENLSCLVDRSLEMANGDAGRAQPLRGKIVGVYFRGSSTRTRTAFTVGALRLGAQTIAYGRNDLQIATGETLQDTGRVLSGFLDILVIRTNETMAEMRALAEQDEMSVVNAMSENEHPTQALADLATIKEAFGRLRDIHVLYLGEGNNTAAALALAVSLTPGMRLTLATPEGYGLPESVLERAQDFAQQNGAAVVQYHDINRLPKGVDAVYTTRWQTMGEPKAEANWIEKFEPFRVTRELMARVSGERTIFLHDLPAVRGGDVTDEVLDGPQSRAFRQARHKLSSAMAALEWCVSAGGF
jgi:ornithine carbamoyltransferase